MKYDVIKSTDQILSTPSETQSVSREQDTDKLLADLRERCAKAGREQVIAAYGGNCGSGTHLHILTVPLRAPVKPMSPFGRECWEPSISVGWKIDSLPFAEWMTHCAKCGHARTPAVGQGEAR